MTTTSNKPRQYKGFSIVKHEQYGRWLQILTHYAINDSFGSTIATASTLGNAKAIIDDIIDPNNDKKKQRDAVRNALLAQLNK